MFSRVLVANRGEIAVRICRTLRAMGISSVAVTSCEDRDGLHAATADVVVHLAGEDGMQAYLRVGDIIDAARRAGAQAIHPGYGFLSESPALVDACDAAGITFIGPPAEAIRAMGDKTEAKRRVARAGVPVVPGVHDRAMSDGDLRAAAAQIGYPVLLKAAAGGGGRGMRTVGDPDGLAAAITSARREAGSAFGDDRLFVERLVAMPRHIEIQVLADAAGAVWALTERECTLQRRHQKIVEESPAPVLHPVTRERMLDAAVRTAQACRYRNAGTVEFLLPGATAADPDGDFFFMEMNTRLQVEHPVTEEIHGIDLVEWQVRIAAGEELPATPPVARGHAVEARLNAEAPGRAFLPTGGELIVYREPRGQGVRVDSGVARGSRVGSAFDPLLAKIVAAGEDRTVALDRLSAALRSTATLGVETNSAFLQALVDDPRVRRGEMDTGLVERELDGLLAAATAPDERSVVPAVAALAWLIARTGDAEAGRVVDQTPGWRLGDPVPAQLVQIVDGDRHHVEIDGLPVAAAVRVDGGAAVAAAARWRPDGRLGVVVDGIESAWDVGRSRAGWVLGRGGRAYVVRESAPADAAEDGRVATVGGPLRSPLPGTVTAVDVAPGDEVTAGRRLVVVEAMKMEHAVVADRDGVVAAVHVDVGDRVPMDAPLVLIAPMPALESPGAPGAAPAATGRATRPCGG